jgi:phospholipase/carboxylesterase
MITRRELYRKGRLTVSTKEKVQAISVEKDVQRLQLDKYRDALLYVPAHYSHDMPASLAVMLHGAGGQAEHGLDLIRAYGDKKNIILLSPASRAATWDIIVKSSFDADVIFIDTALSIVFDRFNIDKKRIGVGGFSDGASYALCIGLSNGDLFTHIIAFSPGFYTTVHTEGKPAVFISHGINDYILPIDPCSRRIVPKLKHKNYHVEYREFIGEHEIPAVISAAAVNWFTEDS